MKPDVWMFMRRLIKLWLIAGSLGAIAGYVMVHFMGHRLICIVLTIPIGVLIGVCVAWFLRFE
jgi:hypothetical protein